MYSIAFITTPQHIGVQVSFSLNWSSLDQDPSCFSLYPVLPRTVLGCCLAQSACWTKEPASQATSQACRVWIYEMYVKSPTIMLPSVSRPCWIPRWTLCHSWLPEHREPGSDRVYIADIYMYLIYTLTHSCLGKKVPSREQKFEKIPERFRIWLALLSKRVILQNMLIVLPSFQSHFIQIFYLIFALTPISILHTVLHLLINFCDFCTELWLSSDPGPFPAHCCFLGTYSAIYRDLINMDGLNKGWGQIVPTFCEWEKQAGRYWVACSVCGSLKLLGGCWSSLDLPIASPGFLLLNQNPEKTTWRSMCRVNNFGRNIENGRL